MTLDVVMEHFVIYERPLDAPEHFVVRRWFIVRGRGPVPDGEVRLAPTLEGARNLVPPGLFPIPRSPSDDRCIVESWI